MPEADQRAGELPGAGTEIDDVDVGTTPIEDQDFVVQQQPSVSGTVNLQADKLTVRGRVGDGDAKINFTAKYKNTTITIRRDGQIKGGKLTMQGGSEISDADIEIDLPPGADLSKPRDPATPIVIKGGKIANYQVITPTAWNIGPRDRDEVPGPIEKAMVGTPIKDPEDPVELGHVARSFDSCLVCTVHAYDGRTGRELSSFVINGMV